MSQRSNRFSSHVCCVAECAHPAIDILFADTAPAIGYPVCREHAERRKWEIALKGNSQLVIDRNKVVHRKTK